MQLGILGGGQLGRMLGQAAQPLGVSTRFLEPAPHPSASVVGDVIAAPYDDPAGLDRLASGCDAVTYEFENVPVQALHHLRDRLPVHPGSAALKVAQDRMAEKTFFRDHGIGTAPFAAVDDAPSLQSAMARIGLPAILKTRREGYDGKGQRRLDQEPTDDAVASLGGKPCILEGVVPFDRELSILAVRGRDGSVRSWPLVENHHHRGILHWSRAPAPGVDAALQATAEGYAARVLEALDYVGVLAIELFQVGDTLLANEMAPRVHNSGHWSIEGAVTSQFENHVRAVLGWPLGSTEVPQPCGCVNLLGAVPELSGLLAIPGASVHLYGKAPRPGRKVGHVTVVGATAAEVDARLDAVRRLAVPQ